MSENLIKSTNSSSHLFHSNVVAPEKKSTSTSTANKPDTFIKEKPSKTSNSEQKTNNKKFYAVMFGLFGLTAVSMAINHHYTNKSLSKTMNEFLSKIIRPTEENSNLKINILDLSKDATTKPIEELSGLDAMKELVNCIKTLKSNTEITEAHRATPPSSLLLWGVPGTGKTTAARGIAKSLGADFIELEKDIFNSEYVHKGAKQLGELCKQIDTYAAENPNKPIVVFIDEIDSIISTDMSATATHSEDMINTLKTNLENFRKRKNIIFIGATNKDPGGIKTDNLFVQLNSAIHSRFDRVVEIDLPIPAAIKDAFAKLATVSGESKFTDGELGNIAQAFNELKMSYRDIKNVSKQLQELDATQAITNKGSYNSSQNLIDILTKDEKIGYDPVRKIAMDTSAKQKIITELQSALNPTK